MSELMMTPEEGEEFNRTLPNEGIDQGVLYSVVDLGTQGSKYGPKRKVELAFELPNQTHTFTEEEGPKPLIVSQIYTLNFNTRSNLYKVVATLLGKGPMTAIDLFGLIGLNANINVEHSKRGEETYAQIGSVMSLINGQAKIKGSMPVVALSLEEGQFNQAIYDALPDWKRRLIVATDEFVKVQS